MKFKKSVLGFTALILVSVLLFSCTGKKSGSDDSNANETANDKAAQTESDNMVDNNVKYAPNELKDGEKLIGDDNDVSVSQWDIEGDTKNSPPEDTTGQQSVEQQSAKSSDKEAQPSGNPTQSSNPSAQSSAEDKLSPEEVQKLKAEMLKIIDDLKE